MKLSRLLVDDVKKNKSNKKLAAAAAQGAQHRRRTTPGSSMSRQQESHKPRRLLPCCRAPPRWCPQHHATAEASWLDSHHHCCFLCEAPGSPLLLPTLPAASPPPPHDFRLVFSARVAASRASLMCCDNPCTRNAEQRAREGKKLQLLRRAGRKHLTRSLICGAAASSVRAGVTFILNTDSSAWAEDIVMGSCTVSSGPALCSSHNGDHGKI